DHSAWWRPDCGAESRRRRRAGSERSLHQNAVEPTAELEADVVEGADQAEAGGAMQLDRTDVGGIPDDRDHLPKSAAFSLDDQPVEECAADPAALRCRGDVDRILDAPAIGRTRAIGPCIGIAHDLPLDLRHQVGIAAAAKRL